MVAKLAAWQWIVGLVLWIGVAMIAFVWESHALQSCCRVQINDAVAPAASLQPYIRTPDAQAKALVKEAEQAARIGPRADTELRAIEQQINDRWDARLMSGFE